MADTASTRFLIELTGHDGQPLPQTEAAALRHALTDHGALLAEIAPPARFADPATLVAVTVAAVQTTAAVTEVIAFLQSWRQGRQVRIKAGGQELPATAVTESSPFISTLMRHPGQPSVRRYALIIAVNSYEDPGLRGLRAPSTDADALQRVLADPGIGGYQVSVLRDADERTVRRQIAGFFADRDPDDLLLLHFSCHGVKDRQNKLHLAASDTELRTLGATGIPASFLDSQMSQTNARRVVLILDCCFSGAYAADMSARADKSVNIEEEFGHSGRVVLTASSATEYAFEGSDITSSAEQPSVFTSALVEGLQTGAADIDGDGDISVDDWYTYAYRAVTSRGVGQVPTKTSSAVSGAFVVAHSVRGATLPAHLMEDLESDRVPVRLAAVERLAALLSRPGSSLHTAAHRELQKLVSDDDSVRVRTAAATALGTQHAIPAVTATAPVAPAPPPPAVPAPTPVAPLSQPVTAQHPVPVPAASSDENASAPSSTVVSALSLHRIAGVLLIASTAFRLVSLSGDSTPARYDSDLYANTLVKSADVFALVIVAAAGIWLTARPAQFRIPLSITAGIAPWMMFTSTAAMLFAARREGWDQPFTLSRLAEIVGLVFATGVFLTTMLGKSHHHPPRGLIAGAFAAIATVLMIFTTAELFRSASLSGTSAVIAATLSITIVYFAASTPGLSSRLLVVVPWAVTVIAGLYLDGYSPDLGHQDFTISAPEFAKPGALVALAAVIIASLIPWTGHTPQAMPMREPLPWLAMILALSSTAFWVVGSAWNDMDSPGGYLWRDILTITTAAFVAFALLRTSVAAAFTAAAGTWGLSLAFVMLVSNGVTPLWLCLAGGAVAVTILYLLRQQPAGTDRTGALLPAAAIVLTLMGVTTWLNWDSNLTIVQAVPLGLLLAAPLIAVWNRGGAEVAAAILGAASGAIPVIPWMPGHYPPGLQVVSVLFLAGAIAIACVLASRSAATRRSS